MFEQSIIECLSCYLELHSLHSILLSELIMTVAIITRYSNCTQRLRPLSTATRNYCRVGGSDEWLVKSGPRYKKMFDIPVFHVSNVSTDCTSTNAFSHPTVCNIITISCIYRPNTRAATTTPTAIITNKLHRHYYYYHYLEYHHRRDMTRRPICLCDLITDWVTRSGEKLVSLSLFWNLFRRLPIILLFRRRPLSHRHLKPVGRSQETDWVTVGFPRSLSSLDLFRVEAAPT